MKFFPFPNSSLFLIHRHLKKVLSSPIGFSIYLYQIITFGYKYQNKLYNIRLKEPSHF